MTDDFGVRFQGNVLISEADTARVKAFRAAANTAWAAQDWKHAAALMKSAEALERTARENAHGIERDESDDMPF